MSHSTYGFPGIDPDWLLLGGMYGAIGFFIWNVYQWERERENERNAWRRQNNIREEITMHSPTEIIAAIKAAKPRKDDTLLRAVERIKPTDDLVGEKLAETLMRRPA